ncbi:hypothetical protein ACFQI7_13905 [Paenibacillus allorhizosphaerae]|uniref:Mannosylglycerate hydrolase MGH1-like glycoside hydrolase domain-containing protein n=1 Tax=Paenibacillus allorhizosphaerae TaxID=2849866 RepID=A0ABN7TUI4_9BACL|nr:hypothetical protein [Paenibacillus allorhizosphaerae]CAG7652450.1 hypothetical protein PAECIP111802_05218 [Paenibacillus allorhizosphaerae]
MSYQLNDFAFDLRASLAPSNHIWVCSGYSTVAPLPNTVAGVKGLFSPPFAAHDVQLLLDIEADGHIVGDTGSFGKGDCGLLYSGAEWRPDRIERKGTYHYFHEGRLISLSVRSTLVPLADRAGFIVSIFIVNRNDRSIDLCVKPCLTPGRLSWHGLDDWDFGHPAPGESAEACGTGIWENHQVRMTFLHEELRSPGISPGQEAVCRMAVVLTRSGEACTGMDSLAGWERRTEDVWLERIQRTCQAVPGLKSDIPGLEDYYRRSLVSGLICLWEHPDFAMQPFPVVSGIEGAGICCYPWDAGGYAGRMLAMLLGSGKTMELAQLMAGSGIERHSRFSPSGQGKDVPYSYSLWSFFNLVWSNLEQHGEGLALYDVMRNLLLADEERLPSWGELLDYGKQRNLLEMRSAAHEHVVSSPNAERAWCYDRLADMAERLGNGEASRLRDKAERIRSALREHLWDAEAGWFLCRYPNGHVERVYTVQAYDSLRMGACTESMTTALLSHLRDGAFLAPYGVSSISAEDTIHYELNDPDWSGGGSYTGECTILALTLWESGQSELAWDVLKRLFWMGRHLPYFPQEHFCDRPAVPAHKRANVIAGLSGCEAILFGMAGLKPGMDGTLTVFPNPPQEGNVSITGYRYRGRLIDVHMKPDYCEIVCDEKIVYKGAPVSFSF